MHKEGVKGIDTCTPEWSITYTRALLAVKLINWSELSMYPTYVYKSGAYIKHRNFQTNLLVVGRDFENDVKRSPQLRVKTS